MKKQILLSCALAWAVMAGAETIDITTFRYAGPYVVQAPFQVDSVDVNSKTFVSGRLLDTHLSVDVLQQGTLFTGGVLPGSDSGYALHMMGFVLENTRYATAKLKIDGLKRYQLYVDGKKQEGTELALEPATHSVVIKYLSEAGKTDSLKVSVDTDQEGSISLKQDNKKLYTLADVLHGTRFAGVGLSPDGRYLIANYRTTYVGGRSAGSTRITELASGKVLAERWRNRSYLAKYDLKTGLLQPLTFGYHNVWAADISNDGRYLLMMTSQSRLTKRPTTLFSLYRLDMQTLQAELLIDKDGFISGARFSPDGTQVLVSGSPESLGGIGKNVKEGQTPSMTDGQLYLLNIADKRVTPLTKDFNPSVQRAVWNKADGQIYFTAENRDCYSLYRMNPADGKIQQLEVSEDLVNSFSLAQNAPVMVYYGQSASNSDRLYTMNTKKMKSSLLEDLSKDILKDVELGECKAWSFTNSRGDTIYGRYYLPPHFDANRKYPMIVNYYGGCSPVSRNFESRYPHHAYAALGYVVYVIEPSGATGFGQEFSARHVNTAGEGVAQDIIEGTKQFCKEHAFVNDKKIGCIGASYGGFMTQYLQTQTDIFAAAISHAGISDHTSYWGEGYWGYSYSEVSMANSYPWSNPDLFVKQSPLFNADKIHTPLLFLHGDADVNVPVGESIQMFTALKLLGRETAFVAVTGQDHHIVDYGKRIQWQNTIFAWFAKWLQDDATWWNAIYKPKAL